MPLACCTLKMQLMALRAASVASHTAAGLRQLSQLLHL